MEYNYIGIDISKAKFDAHWNGQHYQVEQTEKAIIAFIKEITLLVKKANNNPLLFVCEASGGYECVLTRILRKNNLHYHVAHANKVKAFARSKGHLAKTDKLDAYIIAEYASLMKVIPDEENLSENKQKIADLIKRREQLVQDKKREQARLDKIVNKQILNSLKAHIKWLDKEIGKLEDELTELSKSQDINGDFTLLTSMPGVGPLIALYLIALLPELGKASHKEIAALVGVAPYSHDSGKHQGKRFIKGGRGAVRRLLYMGAIASIRYNPELGAFYQQLISRGKPVRVALIAVIRKMLCVLNSIMQRQSAWVKKTI